MWKYEDANGKTIIWYSTEEYQKLVEEIKELKKQIEDFNNRDKK